jgi:hypothetical protein
VTRLIGHFDGKVIVPDGPVTLPLNQKLVIHVAEPPIGTSGPEFLRAIRAMKISDRDLSEMEKAIDEFCETVDSNGW